MDQLPLGSYGLEVLCLITNFVRVAQRQTQQAAILGSSAMTCSPRVSTTRPSATMFKETDAPFAPARAHTRSFRPL